MYWRLGRLRWCRAYLIRDFQAMIDCGNAQAKRLGYDLRRTAKTLFRHWTDYRSAAIIWAAGNRSLGGKGTEEVFGEISSPAADTVAENLLRPPLFPACERLRAAVQRRLAPARREVERLLRHGLASGNASRQNCPSSVFDNRHDST